MSKVTYQTVAVKSSTIKSVSYDPKTRKMTVLFNSGAQYEYSKVESEAYFLLINAKSVGAFLNENIKDNYDYERVA